VLLAVDLKGNNVCLITAYYPDSEEWKKDLKKEEMMMKCHICGSDMKSIVTNLPFKVNETSIVILKDLPVIQCKKCSEYLIEDSVMSRVDEILEKVDTLAELEVIKFAA
jgi:YgiT-type zinc finger domain-containing protein